jgi:D-cysteine desulfhydrase
VIPLVDRFPALDRLARVPLIGAPTPVQRLDALASDLWIKRDDLCADPIGGNKIRALEFLFGGLPSGARVVTVGSAGSTHALSVATFGRRLGFDVRVGRWQQVMNDAARSVSAGIVHATTASPVFGSVASAYAWSLFERARGAWWIPAGGSSPLGVLGHVNSGLELVAQIDAGELPMPKRVFVPLGTGGTVAGLALAFAIAEREIEIVAVRVVPRIVANTSHVRRLVSRTAALIERLAGGVVRRPGPSAIRIVHDEYGGAYGRETDAGREAACSLGEAHGISLDATYSAKAFSRALVDAVAVANTEPTLFWLTFDSRTLDRPPA